jgi:hypothetical protein
MRPEKIREFLHAAPFLPFRVFLSNGSSYHVPHPDFAAVIGSHVIITQAISPDGLPRRIATCEPLHVTHIEVDDEAA